MMRKELFKSIAIILLLTFSFYYAKRISTLLVYKSSLMSEILANKNKYEFESVDAVINGDYIIPGINGMEVSSLESYYQMKNEGVFNKDKIVYKEVEPKVSLANNETLIINKANSYKRKVSIVVSNNAEVENYILRNKIKADKLVTLIKKTVLKIIRLW